MESVMAKKDKQIEALLDTNYYYSPAGVDNIRRDFEKNAVVQFLCAQVSS